MSEQRAGYRFVPHTADLMVEAWGATRDEAFEQAARGLITSFAEITGAVTVTQDLELPADDGGALLALLEEIVFLADARALVPSEVRVRGAVASLGLTELHPEAVTGAPPKAITYHEFSAEQRLDGWHCRFVVDV